jgi:hypothetical protein
LTDK